MMTPLTNAVEVSSSSSGSWPGRVIEWGTFGGREGREEAHDPPSEEFEFNREAKGVDPERAQGGPDDDESCGDELAFEVGGRAPMAGAGA